MYSSIGNQLWNISHYIVSVVLVFVLWPSFIFGKDHPDLLERTFANYIKMVLLIICIVYFLVIAKLYEGISLIIGLFIFTFRKYIFDPANVNRKALGKSMYTMIYDLAEGISKPKTILRHQLKRQKLFWGNSLNRCFGNPVSIINTGVLFIVFAYAAYLRFYDSLTHAAPGMSDAYITMMGMKYLNANILFHDGVYPAGFAIYLSVISKIAYIDPLYILKYTGPMDGILITLGIYFVVSRIAGKMTPGIIAAMIYGTMRGILAIDWERQAATNNQEFVMALAIPTVFFFFLFMESLEKKYFWTAFAGVTAIGLVHSLIFAFVGIGMGLLVVLALMTDARRHWANIIMVCAAGIVSGLISAIPLGIGKLMGRELLSTAVEFLTSKDVQIHSPQLYYIDYIGLLSMFIALGYSLFHNKTGKKLQAELLFAIMGILTFAVYYWGGVVSKSVFVSSRSGDLWSLILPCCIGIGWYVVSKIISYLPSRRVIEVTACLCILFWVVAFLRPKPIIPYKMEYDSGVEQYLRISQMFIPRNWWIVSQEEGYGLAYGKGYHLYLGELIKDYNPEAKDLTKWGQDKPDSNVPPDIFINSQKKVFRTVFQNLKGRYDRQEKEEEEFKVWLHKYQTTHDNINVFYEDDNIRIYHINQLSSNGYQIKGIWDE